MMKYNPKCLNKRIVEAMRVNKPMNIERLDKDGMEKMIEELITEDLSIITFEALADIYKAKYKFTLIYIHNDNSNVVMVTEKDVLWATINEMYYGFTHERYNCLNKTFTDLVNDFDKINVTIIFE